MQPPVLCCEIIAQSDSVGTELNCEVTKRDSAPYLRSFDWIKNFMAEYHCQTHYRVIQRRERENIMRAYRIVYQIITEY